MIVDADGGRHAAQTGRRPVSAAMRVAAVVALALGALTLYLLDKALTELGGNKAGGAALFLVLFTVAIVVSALVAARSMRGFEEH